MTPVTARRRAPQRVDGRRRQGAGRSAGQLPKLFDAAHGSATGPLEAAPGSATVMGEAAPGGATVMGEAALGGATVMGEAAPGGATVMGDGTPGEMTVRVDSGRRVAELPTTAGHGESLDRLVVSSWERLVSHADAQCLLCGGTMEPRNGAHAASIGGRCRDCGTTLS